MLVAVVVTLISVGVSPLQIVWSADIVIDGFSKISKLKSNLKQKDQKSLIEYKYWIMIYHESIYWNVHVLIHPKTIFEKKKNYSP